MIPSCISALEDSGHCQALVLLADERMNARINEGGHEWMKAWMNACRGMEWNGVELNETEHGDEGKESFDGGRAE